MFDKRVVFLFSCHITFSNDYDYPEMVWLTFVVKAQVKEDKKTAEVEVFNAR